MRFRYCLLAWCLATVFQQPVLADSTAHPDLWPQTASPAAITDDATERFITDLMAHMSLGEKIGQTIQADIGSIAPDDLRHYPIGALLAGGDSGPRGDDRAPVGKWVAMIEAFRNASRASQHGRVPIPLLFGIDAVHGNNNIPGATIFPHNIGLGAARDPALIERIGAATAAEVAAIGADWTFGPTLAVPRDPRWGRTYEGFSEEPEITSAYASAMTLGLQGRLELGKPLAPGHVIGAAKHFLGDGGTLDGRDQGDARIDEAELIRLHAQGYEPAIEAGILSVMVSFSSWNGTRHIANHSLLTDVLKQRMGFAGFTVGDWNAHGEVPGCTNTSCPLAMNAGLDMFMAPDSWKGLFEATLRQAETGAIPQARLDDAVRRILRVKIKAGLFARQDRPDLALDAIGAPAHRALARQAVRESLVLLKNDGVLPIAAGAHVLVAGDGADSIGKQCGGWTIGWQGTGNSNSDFPQGQSIYAGIAAALASGGGHAELAPDGAFRMRPDVAVVVFGENPYAEFQGDIDSLEYQPGDKRDLAILRRLQEKHIPVVAIFLSGRPLWTNAEINASDAFVAAWLPGTEGGGIADLIVRGRDAAKARDFTGKLSFSWPRAADAPILHREDAGYDPQFPYGYGLSYAHPGSVGVLREGGAAHSSPPDLDRYFTRGHATSRWTLSAEGDAVLTAIDAGAQENARLATWPGRGPGAIAITGAPVDLSRQATGGMALSLEYSVARPPTRPVKLTLSCGQDCAASVDATGAFEKASSAWRVLDIKLSCFKSAGLRLDHVTSPFALTTAGDFAIGFRSVKLEPDTGQAICPGVARR